MDALQFHTGAPLSAYRPTEHCVPAVSSLPKQEVPTLESSSAERRNLADALAHERNVLRTMIDLIPAFIYAKDAQSRFTACNKLVANRMGVAAGRPDRQDRLRFLPARNGARNSSPTNRR